jgi:hypothetical protein
MRWFAIVLVFSVSAIAAMAQVAVAPVPVPISYGFSNSVIDHNGRVLVFDAMYSYPPLLDIQAIPVRFPPIVTTQVTVIATDAKSTQNSQYQGTFQVVGVGRYAVYAIVTNYTIVANPVQAPTSITRQLVALGPSFPTLPSIDVPFDVNIKVSAVGDDGAPDTIALVPNVVTPLLAGSTGTVLPLPPVPSQPRTVQMYVSDGNFLKALPPVVLSNP